MVATMRVSSVHGSACSGFAASASKLQQPAAGRAVLPQRRSIVTQAISKKELAAQVAQRMPELTKKEAESAVDVTLALIVEAVAAGEKVNIAGFGTFEPRDRSARKGRNPQTGEELHIAATRVPAFSAAKGFKDAVKASMNGSSSSNGAGAATH